MAGVIDEKGVQWEHCCGCGGMFRMDALGYEKPTAKFQFGRDLCVVCVDAGIRNRSIRFRNIRPAATWKRVEVSAR